MPKEKTRWNESSSAGENARAALPALLGAYFSEGRKAMGAAPTSAGMHRFRLHTKRVRYTLEMFQGCYGPGLERYLAALRQIQDHLGAMNDCATTRALVRAKAPKSSPERARMERFLKGDWKRRRADLRRSWGQVFDKEGEERRWRNYLARELTRHERPERL
jgi:CHAD domain-containing protein